jgi:hypothetical protein
MLTAHEMFGFMSPALAGEILSYAFEADKPLYRTAMGAIAEARKVRPIFLERQPRQQRHATMLSSLTRPDMELIANNLIRNWLVQKQNAMLVQFLDGLGIPHEKGVVENLPPAMDDAKLQAAVDGLLEKFPHETVAIYLLAFNEMNEANWPNLKAMLENNPKLQLGSHS